MRLLPLTLRLTGGLKVTVFEADQDAALDLAIRQNSDPYGASCWPSSLCAANHLVDWAERRGSLRGIRLLEVGAGPGLVSLTAAKLGATVVATDIADVSLRLLEAAAIPGMEVRKLDVTKKGWTKDFDVVAASDMLYDRGLAIALGELKRAPRILVTDPGRPYRADFLTALGGSSRTFHNVLVDASELPLGNKAHARIGVLSTI